jgi:hypothetical protein
MGWRAQGPVAVAFVLLGGGCLAPAPNPGPAGPTAPADAQTQSVPNADQREEAATPPPEEARAKENASPRPAKFEILDDGWVEATLREADGKFDLVLSDPAKYRLQIVVSELDLETNSVVTHGYRVDSEFTFAASAIKVFASIAALRKLQSLRQPGLDLDTPFGLCGRDKSECGPNRDETNLDSKKVTLGHEIRKMHLVSNNRAFNRLYDFVGHREINEDAWKLGFDSLRLRHRMGQTYTLGRVSPRLEFGAGEKPSFVVPRRKSDLELKPTTLLGSQVGVARIDRHDERLEEPRDFGNKNYVSTRDLHRVILSVAVPGLSDLPDLELDEHNRAFLLAAMTEDPLTSENPRYTAQRFSGRRYKLMSVGVERVLPLDRVRYINKPGKAYGFHVENAYVEDTKTGRAFAVTAAIYVNDNNVINDDHYEYDLISRPFFKDLGETLARKLLVGE